jgi:hypothetical protein
MMNIKSFKDYNPNDEYKADSRRTLDLDRVRTTKEYRRLINLGFSEETSDQQALNNTMKFVRTKHKQKEKGHSDVFYTIHPSGTVRRYNPIKSDDVPQGNGNDIKKYIIPFRKSSDYKKALDYLWQYIKRKEDNEDFR